MSTIETDEATGGTRRREDSPRHCDIVMKGGITSGVVYPLAAVELSRHYTFKNVGGASAGAIAAACVAAAEHGRQYGKGRGFDGLAELPSWLGTHLSELFQPQPKTHSLFDLVLAATKEKKARAIAAALGKGFLIWLLAGSLPGLALVALAIAFGWGGWSIALGFVVAGLGVPAGFAMGLWKKVKAIPANGFGLCSGGGEERRGETPPLTVWLTRLIDCLAGQEAGRPLTFGDLWGSTDKPERDLNLEMMTTCLTLERPFRVPFDTSDFFFEPQRFRQLFPAEVVNHMERCSREPHSEYDRGLPAHLKPMPPAANLPVVVGVRMSLSFPLLISAVPLWTIDCTAEPENRKPEPCWFSDGGITSNFPVHFFDAPLPRWPTFAINLRAFHTDPPSKTDECEKVWMPSSNHGTLDFWRRWEAESPGGMLIAFLGSIFRTAQNWMDNTQSQAPGYRDRVAHINHTDKEGGLNLSMSPEVIARLSTRGECAGSKLWRRFGEGDGTELTWDNHRWVRYRSLMSVLEPFAERFAEHYREPQAGDRSLESMVASQDLLPSYGWENGGHRRWAEEVTRQFVEAADQLAKADPSFVTGPPEPVPELRVVPRV